MQKFFPSILIIFLLIFQNAESQIKLTHNVGTTPIKTDMYSCDRGEGWSRVFKLSDFGIAPDEQFFIRSGEVAFSESNSGAALQLSVYIIDDNFPEFPNSSYPLNLIGVRGMGYAPEIHGDPEIVPFEFDRPIIVPAGTDRILVSVEKFEDTYNPKSSLVYIAGTAKDTGISYYRNECEDYSITPTTDLTKPIPNANFYINVTGDTFSLDNYGAITTLNHSTCDSLIKPATIGCRTGYMSWSRDFILDDFGISDDEEFIINSGQVGLSFVRYGVEFQFRIYEIDDNFPASFSENKLLGSSDLIPVQSFGSYNYGTQILQIDFENPIVIPKEVDRILVEVLQTDDTAFPAATLEDDGNISWFRSYSGGCIPFGKFVDIKELGYPETKLFINVTGNSRNSNYSRGIRVSNICSEAFTEFSLDNTSNISNIQWNFGDPSSGATNTSSNISPTHNYSADGRYTITASITDNSGSTEIITEQIDIRKAPIAYSVNNIEACESTEGSGISNDFDTSGIEDQVIGNRDNLLITYIDGKGNQYDELPNPFTNTIRDRESITIRVAREDEPCCYNETTFDLIVNLLPDIDEIDDIFECSPSNDGFAVFDLTGLNDLLSNTNRSVEFYHQDGERILNNQLSRVSNKVKDQETINIRIVDTQKKCEIEKDFIIGTSTVPDQIEFPQLIGCDDNNDGISEYFDTAPVINKISENQDIYSYSFYTSDGTELTSLPNPYTNIKSRSDYILVRVTNKISGCYSENEVSLITSSQPIVNQISDLYACDEGGGYAYFETDQVTKNILEGQTNLNVTFFNAEGTPISDFTESPFRNQIAFDQEIVARVENITNPSCYTEVFFQLHTVSPPEINLEDQYQICFTGASLDLQINTENNYTLTWFDPYGDILSHESAISISSEGIYSLSVLKEEGGILCESFKEFSLVHSEPPKIDNISYDNFTSESSIEITSSGEGDFEYSIDGINFQQSNIFRNVTGGHYQVTVRDRYGCGEAIEMIDLVNYNHFFTPNNDGINDYWNILGISNQPNASVHIFDRYGIHLAELPPDSQGWDGTFKGKLMPENDYWFKVTLENGSTHTGHFSLLR